MSALRLAHRRALPAALLWLALLVPAPANGEGGAAAPPAAGLRPGSLLVASRNLRDPSFRETVVVVVDYAASGATGLILNRPTPVPFASAIPEIDALKRLSINLYLGGPVARYQVGLLVRAPAPLPAAQARLLFDSVYFSGQLTTLLALLKGVPPGVTVHAYAGHAGWGPGQLDAEVRGGGWHVTTANAATCFDTGAAELWPTLIERVEPRAILTRLEPPWGAR
ncbi:MAG: hypothetical protein COW73_01735 [Nitrospirae bacterium CG18_big_fil_WC_8_21_14_2_50_70_55]|nr:YqgE/AlgH family protein [Deltaproteobacteria bacterium]OIP66492.1 MAG: hypothetical protein AUK30_02355 [Nitrospirae bacterium CG2_30_70_394]PIQ06911.1 MAG: hypothetical protein COW73_01735 [Nitrospirae bacterium CG18_big_fil_WC_8_21_14_2_50_70_55]PIU79644.1 MAG: hypothetical protein COS73_03495 [Nitrospirae bacterium CG06_land_8_20_14_3_00_70_43]PIW83583.1 MAG: hypothetical protein COZ96_02620 [Nitrospirae bacterium CG_4_8_14_3_um_filter_70_85]PIX82996.1 MAG: hypothetical protein COZ33_07